LNAKVVNDEFAKHTTIVVSEFAPKARLRELIKRAQILVAPLAPPELACSSPVQRSKFSPLKLDLRWLLKTLGAEEITSLLIEGGGEVNAAFLLQGLAHRIAFFYAPKILGGRDSLKSVAGDGVRHLNEALELAELKWCRLGLDWLLTARVSGP
jgi:diaminohydroxyphosphoribosylaminopyrimidine deaminase/5-amino-6-(5-phosphoribosylamino)uracil reductase